MTIEKPRFPTSDADQTSRALSKQSDSTFLPGSKKEPDMFYTIVPGLAAITNGCASSAEKSKAPPVPADPVVSHRNDPDINPRAISIRFVEDDGHEQIKNDPAYQSVLQKYKNYGPQLKPLYPDFRGFTDEDMQKHCTDIKKKYPQRQADLNQPCPDLHLSYRLAFEKDVPVSDIMNMLQKSKVAFDVSTTPGPAHSN